MLDIKNLSYTAVDEQGETGILKDISLSVPDGQFVVITGPNGGGKSTLAKCIAGIYTPTAGSILFDLQRAAAGAQIQGFTGPAQRRHIFLISQLPAKRGIPDSIPGIGQDIPHRLVPGLARQDIPVRFDAHTEFCC